MSNPNFRTMPQTSVIFLFGVGLHCQIMPLWLGHIVKEMDHSTVSHSGAGNAMVLRSKEGKTFLLA